jgi:hypothetical protein
MFSKILCKLTATGPVEFCDQCSRVCTGACRAEAQFSKAREQAAYQIPFIR